jgi:fucose permease
MEAYDNAHGTQRRALTVLTVYLAGMLQGLTLVSFPASSAALRLMHGFSDAQYGTIFLPQVAAAVIGALAGGQLATRLGLRRLLWIALLINALSQLLLAGTQLCAADTAFVLLLLGTASLGLGFGVSGAPLNGLPPLLFPARRDTALVALHTCLGLGLAVGPLLANPFIMSGLWVGFPLLLAGLCVLLALLAQAGRYPEAQHALAMSYVMALQSGDPVHVQSAPPQRDVHPARHPVFWLLALIAVLYAFAEGTFGNWAILYLQDVKHLPETVAAAALSVFWMAMVAGRLLTSVLVLRVAPQRIWLLLPLLMIAAFLLLPYADTPLLGIALFALSGLACSAFFPLSIGIASERFHNHVAWVSSLLIAALMVGVGLGSWLVGLLRGAFPMEQLYRLSTAYPVLVLVLVLIVLRGRAPSRAAMLTGANIRTQRS